MRRRHLAVLAILGVLLVASAGIACRKNPAAPPSRGGILFIGNSLTGQNDLPEIVAAFFAASGDPVEVEAVVRDGASLADQLTDQSPSGATGQIARGGWSVVVLQQGPSALPESRVELVQSTVAFDRRIRVVGARTALFSVWPMSDRMTAFDSVALSYGVAASTVGGILLPATRAWQAAWRLDPSAPLYSFDGFHPSPEGSYLAAATIYAVLSGRSPLGLPATLRTAGGLTISIAPAMAGTLQRAAAEAAAGS